VNSECIWLARSAVLIVMKPVLWSGTVAGEMLEDEKAKVFIRNKCQNVNN
jgi:hypothetical protein